MSLSAQEITEKILTLSKEEQEKILDFIEFIQTKSARQQAKRLQVLQEKQATGEVYPTEGKRVLAILKKTGFLGSMPDIPDLSENYKDYLDWGDKI